MLMYVAQFRESWDEYAFITRKSIALERRVDMCEQYYQWFSGFVSPTSHYLQKPPADD